MVYYRNYNHQAESKRRHVNAIHTVTNLVERYPSEDDGSTAIQEIYHILWNPKV